MTTSAQAVTPKSGRHNRSFKNYLIDSRFQLKYTSYLVAVAVFISGILGGFLWKTSRDVVEASSALTAESKKVSEISRMNIEKLGYGDDAEFLKEFSAEAAEQDHKVELRQAALVARQQTMINALVGGLVLLVVLIGLLGIYITHKVAGPIFKMKRLLSQVGDGKLVFEGKLRKGDELQDFFETFQTMVEKLRARQAAEVSELEKAIEMARASGANAESIAKVVLVRDEMKRAIDL
jgi:nitrogen fixation/metabolism regulation signal transduction histidine kinase